MRGLTKKNKKFKTWWECCKFKYIHSRYIDLKADFRINKNQNLPLREFKSFDGKLGLSHQPQGFYRKNKWILPNEEIIIPPILDNIGDFSAKSKKNFSDSIAKYKINHYFKPLYGFVHGMNNYFTPALFHQANNFVNDIALVKTWEIDYFLDREFNLYETFTHIGELKEGMILAKIYKEDGYKKTEKYGFLNEYGEIAINFDYDNALDFDYGLALVKKNNKYGFIDKNNNTVIDFIYDEASSFKDDLAVISLNGKFGVINKQGDYFIEPELKFDNLCNFHEDLAAFEHNKKWGFINKRGEISIPAEYYDVTHFLNGYSTVSVKIYDDYADIKHGIINNNGEFIVPAISDQLFEFQKGSAIICLRPYILETIDNQNLCWCLQIDKFKNIITKDEKEYFKKIQKFTLWDREAKNQIIKEFLNLNELNEEIEEIYYLINEKAEIISKPYAKIEDFSDGLARVIDLSTGILSYIDTSGNEVVQNDSDTYSEDQGFSEGLAPFSKENQWGFIDKAGKIVISNIYDEVKAFSEGLAAVKINEQWGYIDKTGRFVINPRFYSACSFENGIGVVKPSDETVQYINKDGKIFEHKPYVQIKVSERFSKYDLQNSYLYYDKKFMIKNNDDKILNPVKDFRDLQID